MTRDFFIPRHGAAYVMFVIACGFCVIGFSAYDLAARILTAQWFTLAALTLLSGSATVKLPSVPEPSRFPRPSSSPRFCCLDHRRGNDRSP